MRHLRLPDTIAAFLVVTAILAASACVDLTPVEAAEKFRLGTNPDAGGNDGSGPMHPCKTCFLAEDSEVSCAAKARECYDDYECGALWDCMIAEGCVDMSESADINRCGVPCALRIGIPSADDRSVVVGVELADCAGRKCPDVCFPGSLE